VPLASLLLRACVAWCCVRAFVWAQGVRVCFGLCGSLGGCARVSFFSIFLFHVKS
jgi:hypothetical protein